MRGQLANAAVDMAVEQAVNWLALVGERPAKRWCFSTPTRTDSSLPGWLVDRAPATCGMAESPIFAAFDKECHVLLGTGMLHQAQFLQVKVVFTQFPTVISRGDCDDLFPGGSLDSRFHRVGDALEIRPVNHDFIGTVCIGMEL